MQSPVAPSDFDRPIPGYRLIQTASFGDPYRARTMQGQMTAERRAYHIRNAFYDTGVVGSHAAYDNLTQGWGLSQEPREREREG